MIPHRWGWLLGWRTTPAPEPVPDREEPPRVPPAPQRMVTSPTCAQYNPGPDGSVWEDEIRAESEARSLLLAAARWGIPAAALREAVASVAMSSDDEGTYTVETGDG